MRQERGENDHNSFEFKGLMKNEQSNIVRLSKPFHSRNLPKLFKSKILKFKSSVAGVRNFSQTRQD